MAFDSFIKIDGIPGESSDHAHQDWIEVLSYDHKLEQPASSTASSVGGATAERVQHGTFNFVHHLDKASPKLHDACCTGKHIKEVVVELCRAGGNKMKYMEIRMEQVMISRIEEQGAAAGDSGFPSEKVALSYGKIKWTYTQQKREDGSGGGNVSAGWDLTANKAIA
ncbi:type VI secretion system secreted protein Hcp [Noviherbaspirillum humi]|uniref:Type VI secretion system secreted protein Hcp n=1 Tax=Noviherbaspirillum humi TaxID=1688639 RepID=A0A239DKS0_9BURK|nr:type VI secretion system tube protein Hcp [Noviherbaspirillum humi]SNS32448.1 type VI secretion system secreted protein Hcp [Noviherbaspirillum humi]